VYQILELITDAITWLNAFDWSGSVGTHMRIRRGTELDKSITAARSGLRPMNRWKSG
jgi:hypothetical protein